MEKTKKQILQERVKKGQNAQQALDVYLSDFFKERESYLYKIFSSSDFDESTILELKRQQIALIDLKNNVLWDISYGKDAEKELLTLE